MRTSTRRIARVSGALIVALALPSAGLMLTQPASADSAVQPQSVQVHTWAQEPGSVVAHHASLPTGTWIDGVHGPVLDGAFISTPTFVIALALFACLAVVMAARAASTGRASSRGAANTGFATAAGATSTTRAERS